MPKLKFETFYKKAWDEYKNKYLGNEKYKQFRNFEEAPNDFISQIYDFQEVYKTQSKKEFFKSLEKNEISYAQSKSFSKYSKNFRDYVFRNELLENGLITEEELKRINWYATNIGLGYVKKQGTSEFFDLVNNISDRLAEFDPEFDDVDEHYQIFGS